MRRDYRLISKKLTFHSVCRELSLFLFSLDFSHHCCGLVGIFHMSYAVFLFSILDSSLYHILYLVRSWHLCTIAQRSFRFNRDFINLLLPSHMLCVCCLLVVWTWIPLCPFLSSPSTNHSPSLSDLLNIFGVSFFVATLYLKPFVISLQTLFFFN